LLHDTGDAGASGSESGAPGPRRIDVDLVEGQVDRKRCRCRANLPEDDSMDTDEDDDDIPPVARPDPAELSFDLDRAQASVVTVRAEIAADAYTAPILGTERQGNGVVIDAKGLTLTIGYLVTEAERVWILTARGGAVPGHVLAYDQATGFGLVQALGALGAPAMPLGRSERVEVGQPVVITGGRGARDALSARVVACHGFAGYWEYYLEAALFTAPAHPRWGGAACIGPDGRLVGIGSLLVQEAARGGQNVVGNMVVPIDLLPPILNDLVRYGRVPGPPRPWLGLYATDTRDGITVTGLAPGGPAAAGGLAEGDTLTEINGEPLEDLGDLWRKLWATGPAGVTVTLAVVRNGRRHDRPCRTADRQSFLKQPWLH
jgi:S1-C subfamily serine protease